MLYKFLKAPKRQVAAGKVLWVWLLALYIACLQNNDKVTQKDIAEAAGVPK